jgi:hypothetical protein
MISNEFHLYVKSLSKDSIIDFKFEPVSKTFQMAWDPYFVRYLRSVLKKYKKLMV